jgi:2-methylcitrate dehydratase PrpD
VLEAAYRTAFVDWLACAVAGRSSVTAVHARILGGDALARVAALGTAGHSLDFDDTYAPGLAHCTAPTAPVALALGAERSASMTVVLGAYARGYEAMAAVARASHPELYERGWHPTAVCGAIGAAVAASSICGLDPDEGGNAVRLAMLQASGLRASFGSEGKALQVGLAAAAGARGGVLALDGVGVADAVRSGFEAAYGATVADPDPSRPAILENWIKAYPCCLQTHSAIEAAARVRRDGVTPESAEVRVHPISLQAAPHRVPSDSLGAKFSIPYTTAFAMLHGPPGVESFRRLDPDALRLTARVEVVPDEGFGQSAAELRVDGHEPIRVEAALGSPQRPMDDSALRAKVRSLTGQDLADLFDDSTPARDVLAIVTA